MIKPIQKFPGYSVSDNGDIYSESRHLAVDRNVNCSYVKTIRTRILKPSISGNGYLFVTLRKDKKAYPIRIHTVVASEFIGVRPKGLVVHHKDNDKLNNAASNLEYTTRQINTQEYFKSTGKRRGNIPLNQLHSIFTRVSSGESLYRIADDYNVTRNDIATITRVLTLTGEELTIK